MTAQVSTSYVSPEIVSLWAEASRDIEREQRLHTEARANVALERLWPFFALAKSLPELEHRKALARDSLERIASESGMPLADVAAMVDRHYALLVEASAKTAAEEGGQFEVVDKNTDAKVAGPFDDREEAQEAIANNDSGLPSSELKIVPISEGSDEGEEGEEKEARLHRTAVPEGENILAETVNDASGPYGAGPEKPIEHNDGPDDNIPPDARNKIPDAVAKTMSVTEARRILDLAKTAVGEYVDPSQMSGDQAPGTIQQNVPAAGTAIQTGVQPETPPMPGSMPPGAVSFPVTTKPRQMPGGGDSGADVPGDTEDPIADQITQVTSAIRRDNPGVSESVARRVARQTVAKLLTAAGNDQIDYVNPTIPKPRDVAEDPARDEEDGGLAGHAAETAGAGMLVRKVLPLAETLV